MIKGSKKKPPAPAPKLGLSWRWNYEGESRRVWNNSWGGDAFEIISNDVFAVLQQCCKQFGISLEEAED